MCIRGHAYFRAYDAGCWYLACCHCPHRILEGRVEQPAPVVVDIPLPAEPENEELAA